MSASAAVRSLRVGDVADAQLARDAKAAGLALSVDELRRIATALGRDPSVVEAHAFDAQWSEHCSYKSSRAFLGRLPTTGPDVLLGVGQDAGIVRLGDHDGETYGIVVAHESHNHPSQVVPFEGAATGIGGIVRDVLCMGAELIAVADPLRLGPQDDPHCRYVAQGVVDGIAAYGNAIGVPNVAGDVYFHDGFRDNCLVNVIALGVVARRNVVSSAAPAEAVGWDVVLVGKATDRSGFGGAAFSSLVLDDEDAEANKGAVQVPDPFLKNVVMRATYRAFAAARAAGVTLGCKDLGAGGIMGCTAELVGGGGLGAVIDLDRCPTAHDGLPPEVIAIGETQERLAFVSPPHFTSALLAVFNDEFGLPNVARGACAATIGTVTAEPRYVLRHHGETVMDVALDFLTGGVRYERPYELPTPSSTIDAAYATRADRADRLRRAFGDRFVERLAPRVAAHRDVCSRAPIFERYDSVVRGATALGAGVADAGVVCPVPGSPLAAAVGIGGNPRCGAIDPGWAARRAVLEAVQKVVAVGARPVGLTDCLNFGNPQDPRHMGDFVAAIDGLAEAARAFDLPYVSGNVSLYNQSAAGNAVPASPIVACIGAADDVSRLVTPDFKGPRDGEERSTLFRLGRVEPGLAGSVAAEVAGLDGDVLPRVDLAAYAALHRALLAAIGRGLVLACADVSDGGMLATLAEMRFASVRAGRALDVEVRTIADGDDADAADALFGEGGGFAVEIANEAEAFEALLAEHGVDPDGRRAIGEVRRGGARAAIRADRFGTVDLDALRETWSAPLRGFYDDVPAEATV